MESLEEFFLQPVGQNGIGRTIAGPRAYAQWEGMDVLDDNQRKELVATIEAMSGVNYCRWYTNKETGEHFLQLGRVSSRKWDGENGLAREICRVVGKAMNRELSVRMGGVN